MLGAFVSTSIHKEIVMGKYVLGWFLGIPAVLLVVLYLIFH